MPLHDVKCSKCLQTEEIFYQPGSKPSNYECNKCGKLQDFKPLLSSPIIKMAGERQIERALEKSAGDGLF